MNILLTILIVIVLLVALVMIIAIFTKKEYAIEKEIIINKPKKIVFNYIKYLKNQNNYSKWAMMDPGMKQTFYGTDGTVGFTSAWDSDNKKVGKGEQKIRRIIEGERVEYEIHFIKPFEGRAIAYITATRISETQTKVKWGFDSSMKYPMNIMLLFMNMEKLIGGDLTTGLVNLKAILEK